MKQQYPYIVTPPQPAEYIGPTVAQALQRFNMRVMRIGPQYWLLPYHCALPFDARLILSYQDEVGTWRSTHGPDGLVVPTFHTCPVWEGKRQRGGE
jgi:hypothetical protein